MRTVYLFDSQAAGKAKEYIQDDIVSRQSVTLRDAQVLGTDHDGLLVILEGDEAAIQRFEEIAGSDAKRLSEEDAKRVFSLLKREEEDAAEGVGFLFG